MPPILATALTCAFIILLLVSDPARRRGASPALWLPFAWMVITGSRFVSQWMSLGTPVSYQQDGSAVDATYFLFLIFAGIVVLARRRVTLAELFRDNRWLAAFLVYCLIAILWSDEPFVAFKRWIKVLGHPVMALIVLTDRDPVNAFRIVMRRCAYFLIPGSVLFIKYYPEYGRAFDSWTGAAANSGVALTKNDLGYVCMVFGLYFTWSLLTSWRAPRGYERTRDLVVSAGFLGMILWLLDISDSMTSLATMCVAVFVLFVLRVLNPRTLGTVVVAAVILVVSIESTFHLYPEILRMLDRSPSLTDRTHLWADALAMQGDPLLGAGFESFWLGERLAALWAKWWWRPTQAHNGYIETYLSLGMIGVFLLVGMLVSTFRKAQRQITVDFDFASFRLALLVAIVMFNYTEATFKGVHLLWTMFYLIAAEYRYPKRSPLSQGKHHGFRASPAVVASKRSAKMARRARV